MLKVKLTDCSAHSVLSVKAVMVTVYFVTASRPDRITRVSVVSPTAVVPFCHSTWYLKDHMSGVDGLSHNSTTLGGIGPSRLAFCGGSGQAAWGQVVKSCQITSGEYYVFELHSNAYILEPF